METDYQELANMWARGGNQRSHVAPIIRDIIELSSGFNDFTLMYASRSCNRVAHVLTKQLTDVNRLGEWQSASTCIHHVLTEDCTLLFLDE
jgi:hypothetical protein